MNSVDNYPMDILPSNKYKTHICLEELKESLNYYVSRRINGYFEASTDYIEIDDEYELRAKVIEDFDANLSMNLLGAKFKLEHTSIHQNKEISKPWPENEIPTPEDLINNSEYTKSFPAIFSAYDIFRENSYERTELSKPKFDELFEKLQKLGDSQLKRIEERKLQLTSKTCLVHKPTISNYWHVEIKLFPSLDEPPFKNTSSKWKETLWNLYKKQIFSVVIKPEVIESEIRENPIDSQWYEL